MSNICAPTWPAPTPGARRQTIGCEFGNTCSQLREQVCCKFVRDISRVHMFILAIIHSAAAQNIIVADAMDAANILR